MKKEVFESVGKNTQKRFLKGDLTEQMLIQIYNRMKKEADEYPEVGLSYSEMSLDLRTCKNPILAKKIKFQMEEFRRKSELSKVQNKQSLLILDDLCQNACGVGLRALKRCLQIKGSNSLDDLIVYKLLCLEWTNLAAKKYNAKSKVIYQYKNRLLQELKPLLACAGWIYGISRNVGKNASGIIFVYLPNGSQLSWHCGYQQFETYPPLEVDWDGKCCSTLTKIVDYAQNGGMASALVA